MIRSLILASFLILFSAFTCAAQSSGSGAPAPSEPSKPSAQSQLSAAPQAPASAANAAAPKDQSSDKDQTKKKPKKVWTNEEMPTLQGKISVVGDPELANASSESRKWNNDSDSGNANNLEREKAIANYREQLRQLRERQDGIDKKITDFRNFKADNASPSGGINLRNRYTMTPAEDQIRQLEDQKKQIQAKIDAIEDEARKNGIEPGELR
jgi:CCR4-NOT transcriptional regulation complex NOT5 subunit